MKVDIHADISDDRPVLKLVEVYVRKRTGNDIEIKRIVGVLKNGGVSLCMVMGGMRLFDRVSGYKNLVVEQNRHEDNKIINKGCMHRADEINNTKANDSDNLSNCYNIPNQENNVSYNEYDIYCSNNDIAKSGKNEMLYDIKKCNKCRRCKKPFKEINYENYTTYNNFGVHTSPLKKNFGHQNEKPDNSKIKTQNTNFNILNKDELKILSGNKSAIPNIDFNFKTNDNIKNKIEELEESTLCNCYENTNIYQNKNIDEIKKFNNTKEVIESIKNIDYMSLKNSQNNYMSGKKDGQSNAKNYEQDKKDNEKELFIKAKIQNKHKNIHDYNKYHPKKFAEKIINKTDLFLAALLIIQKMTKDNPMNNRAWSVLSDMEMCILEKTERYILKICGYKFDIGKIMLREEVKRFKSMFKVDCKIERNKGWKKEMFDCLLNFFGIEMS